MILYHFTTELHLPKILADRYLKVTESNLSRTRAHAGPDVVWLTTRGMAADHTWWHSPIPGRRAADKTEIRFTIDVPKRDAHKWWTWARGRGIDLAWAETLSAAGGSHSWYVVQRPIPASEWIEVVDTRTSEAVSTALESTS